MSADKKDTLLFTLTGPIASGKSTIAKQLAKTDPSLFLSISTTTRTPRKGEVDGEDYFFVSEEEFQEKIKSGEFLEYAEFCGNHYGTELRNIELAGSKGKDLLLDIEVQGVEQLKLKHGENLICVFVFPVSFAEMKSRLVTRGKDSEEQIAKRLKRAEQEVEVLKDKDFSDYFLLNDKLELAVEQARTIVTAERLRLRADLDIS